MASRATSEAAVGTANSSSSPGTGGQREPGSGRAARAAPKAIPEGLQHGKQVQSWEQPGAVQR